MGAINFTINKDLVVELKKFLKLDLFVETGTYKGDTLNLVKDLFGTLYSCEIDEKYFQALEGNFKNFEKIKIFNSTSPLFLSNVKPMYENSSALFWLDAHFMSESQADVDLNKCPLMDELSVIQKINDDSVILVDDARYLTSPPPYPNDFKNWPDFTSVVRRLFALSEKHDLVVFNDVLVLFPRKIKNELFQFMSKNTFDVLKIIDRANEYEKLILQVNQKETEIKNLLSICEVRLSEINSKESEIKNLLKLCDDRVNVINIKEHEIKTLFFACEERVKKIDSINQKVKILEDIIIAKDLEIKSLKSDIKKTQFFQE